MNRKEIWKQIKDYIGLYEVSNFGRVRSLNYRGTGRVQVLKLKCARNGYLHVSLCKNGNGKTFLVHKLVWEAFNGEIQNGYELDHINTVRDDARLENLRCVIHKANQNNPITRKRYLEAMKKLHANQEYRKKHAEAMKKLAQDPNWKRKNAEANKKKTQDPNWRRNYSEAIKKLHADPEFRKKQAEAARKANSKPVLQIDKTTGCCMGKWDSMSDVERVLGIHSSNIAKCCSGKIKSAGGYRWKYA